MCTYSHACNYLNRDNIQMYHFASIPPQGIGNEAIMMYKKYRLLTLIKWFHQKEYAI